MKGPRQDDLTNKTKNHKVLATLPVSVKPWEIPNSVFIKKGSRNLLITAKLKYGCSNY